MAEESNEVSLTNGGAQQLHKGMVETIERTISAFEHRTGAWVEGISFNKHHHDRGLGFN